MGNVLVLDDSNFDNEVLSSDIPVLVDFWAEWCGPCKQVGPTVEEIAGEYSGKVKVGKVDVTANQMLAGKFSVRSIPTLLVFKDGKVAGQIVGNVPKAKITEKLDAVL